MQTAADPPETWGAAAGRPATTEDVCALCGKAFHRISEATDLCGVAWRNRHIIPLAYPSEYAHDKCNGRMRCAASKACRAAPAASTREAGPRRRSQARCLPSPPPQPRPSVLPSTGGGWGRSGVQQAERGEECRSEEGPAAPRRTWYSQSGEQPEEGACGGQSTRSLEPDALQPPPVQPPPGHLLGGMRTAMQWQAERGGAEPARVLLSAAGRTEAGSRCNWKHLSADERTERGRNEYAGRLAAEARAAKAEGGLRTSSAKVAELRAQLEQLQVGYAGLAGPYLKPKPDP